MVEIKWKKEIVMSHLFVNCEYGISGDLTLAALVDLGADPHYIESELNKLPIDEFSMSFSKKDEKGITANKLNLSFTELDEGHDHHGHHHHSAQGIFQLIEESDLADRVKERSLAIFKEVARAEGKIHGKPIDEIHFHEVGAMDSIIDIIGVCLALEDLDVDHLTFSKVPTGHGKIEIAHGLYPVPAPATMEILVGVPLSSFTAEGELTTPTGAAFAKVLADDYADVVEGTIEKIGYGVGDREFDHPNVLRVALVKKN